MRPRDSYRCRHADDSNSHTYTAAAAHHRPFRAGRRVDRAASTDRALLRRVLMIGGVALVAMRRAGAVAVRRPLRLHRRRLCPGRQADGLHRRVRSGARTWTSRKASTSRRAHVLFRLDPAALPDRRCRTPRPQLDQTALHIDAMKQDYKRMQADIAPSRRRSIWRQRNYRSLRPPVEGQCHLRNRPTTMRALRCPAPATSSPRWSTPPIRSWPSWAARSTSRRTQHPQYLEAQAKVE